MLPAIRLVAAPIFVATLALSMSPSASAVVITDDFSDGTDGSAGTTTNPTPSPPNVTGPVWSRLDGYAFSSGQAWNASTGAYRLTAENNGFDGFGAVGAYIPTSFTDVKVTADVVVFGGPPLNPAFGVLARINGDNGFVGMSGYGYVYEPYAASGTGEMVLYRFDPGLVSPFNDLASQQVTLDPSKDYRMSLTITGSQLHGQVFEIGGGMVAEKLFSDATYSSGFSGLLSLSQEDGDVPGTEPTPDFTIDNFRTEDPPTVLQGDYNLNGKVDGADYVVWRKNPGGFGGDPTGYNTWRANFGNPPGGGSGLGIGGAVPEPSAIALFLLGLVGCRWAAGRCTIR